MLLEDLNNVVADTPPSEYKIFVDLDGVLFDFVAGVNSMFKVVHDDPIKYNESRYKSSGKYRSMLWDTIREYQKKYKGKFWYELPLMDDAKVLWDYVKRHDHEILTATGDSAYGAGPQKRKIVKERFGDVKVNLSRRSAEKATHARQNYILIDDQEKSIGPWEKAGGIGILHTSAADTINKLKKLGL